MVGLLDFFTGGDPAEMAQIDPRYGVARSDVRDAAVNTLANLSATLLAAGQPIMPAQRAQYLSQLGQAGAGFNTDLYNASQRRLMTAQMDQRRAEAEETRQIQELMKNPEAFRAQTGYDLSQFGGMRAGDVSQALRQIRIANLSRDPEQQNLIRAQIAAANATGDYNTARALQLRLDMDTQREAAARLARGDYGAAAPTSAAGAPSTAAPVPREGGAPAAAPAPAGGGGEGGVPRPPLAQMPRQMVDTLLAAGVKPSEIAQQQTRMQLNQNVVVAVPPDSPLRRQFQVGENIPFTIKLDATGNIVDWKTGEDANKPPSGYYYAEPPRPGSPGRLMPVPGGPQEQIAAEVGGRVGLAQAFTGFLPEINKALDDGVLTRLSGRTQILTGVGDPEAASILRRIDIGKEALLRGLTGAGMSESEARQYADRWSPSARDTAATIRDKVRMLEYSLNNVQEIVTRSRGGVAPAGQAPTFNAPRGTPALPPGFEVVR